MSNIKLDNPLFLLLMIPMFVFIIVSFFMLKKGKSKVKNIVSLLLHLFISVLLVVSCAKISVLKSIKNSEVYILADVSESTKQQEEQIDKYILDINNQIDNVTKLGVICYGKNYEVLTPLGGQIKSVSSSKVDKSATDLEGVLRFTNSYFSNDVIKKIILITDGEETDNHSLNAMQELKSNNVYIDAIYLKHPLLENEVQINSLSYNEKVFLNHDESLKVSVQTSRDCQIDITLYLDNQIKETKKENLAKGINIIEFDLDTSKEQLAHYKITITSDQDTYIENNEMFFVQDVTSDFKVMVVGKTRSDCLTAMVNYDLENTEVDYFFNNEDIPYRIEELLKYDEILFTNFNIVSVNHHEELVENLELYVSKYGKSLITYGETYASGTSSPIMSKYNNILPVQFESVDAKCLALVIDASSSMETDNRLDKAVEGAIACLDLLGEKDYVTVISFGEKTKVLQPLTSAKNREQIINSIKSITVSYATNMVKGIQEAYSQIRTANFENKHMIVLTDGLPYDDEYILNSTVENMARNNVVSSFINISCKEGESLLKNLAILGNGEYYFITSSSDIVNVILTSVSDVVTNTKIEKETKINVAKEKDILLENVSDLPNIQGYNFCRIKGSANTILTVTYTNELGGEREVPLLAYWTYGKGKVISFTSNANSTWTSDLINSSQGKILFNNITSFAQPETKIDTMYKVDITTKGFSSEVIVELDFINQDAFLEMNLIYPNGNNITRYFKNLSNVYSTTFLTDIIGEYTLELTYHHIDYTYQVVKHFSFCYSKEYDMFTRQNEQLLYEIVGEDGTISFDGKYEINASEVEHRYYENISVYLLITSVILFIVDVTIRKLNIKDLYILLKRRHQ